MSIVYANICSSVQDHRQKICVFKTIGTEEQMRAIESTKWKLVLQKSILVKEVLKTRGSEADVIRSILIRSWTSEAEVIRGSEGS